MPKSLPNQKAVLAYPHGHEVSARFHKCLVNLLVHDAKHHQRIVAGGGHLANSSGANITNARNEIVEAFLDHHDADWLWFLDTDMTFDPDILDRLVKAAHPEKRPIVGALCFSLQDGCRAAPTIYILRDDGKVGRVFDYPPGQVIQVGATGTGCVLIHRSVLGAMRGRFPKPYQWFQESAVGALPVGEDITFCIRAGAQGFPVHVDTSITCGHEKPFVVDESMFAAQRRSLQAAELPIYVIVPFKDRHDLTGQLIDSLDGYARLLLFDNGSENPPPEDWPSIPAAGMNIHQMWNRGVEIALGESGGRCNIAILNNDIKVSRGFLDQLAKALRFDDRFVAVSPNYDGREFDADIQVVQGICANRYDGSGGLAGFAFLAKGEWFDNGYRFPEECAYWWGDTDFALSVKQAGGLMGIVKHVHCEHIDGGGQTERPADWDERNEADKAWFMAKWGLREQVA